MSRDGRDHRQMGMVAAVTNHYQAFIDPELLDVPRSAERSLVQAVGEAIGEMREYGILPTIHHFGVS